MSRRRNYFTPTHFLSRIGIRNGDLLIDTVKLAKDKGLEAAGIAMHVLAEKIMESGNKLAEII